MSEEWNDRIEKKIEFLVDQQAQFFASLEKHSEQFQQIRSLVQSNSEQIQSNSDQIQRNSEQILRNSELIALNSQNVGRLADIVTEFARIVDERFERTDERLNILIGAVERHFSDGSQ